MNPHSIAPGLIVTLHVATAVAAQVSAPADLPSYQAPKYGFLRFNEDWSGLADAPDARTGWDAIKYVPLSEDGDVWASFGGSLRLRFESWSDFAFGAPAIADDEFLLFRALLHADVHVGESVRLFVEGKTAQATERELPGGRRALDVDSLDLQLAFVDLRIPLEDGTLTIRPGRQELLFGKQRLVSPLAWSNTLRAWDGISAILTSGDWKTHAFWTQYAPVGRHDFNESDAQTQFFGIYATGKVPETDVGLDAYFLGLDRDDAVTFNGTTGPEERYTLGGRLFGRFGESDFDYELEGAYQFGEVGAGDVDACMIGSQIGWKAPDCWAAPRFSAGFDLGSGDDGAGGDVGTFNHLFPLGHAFLGYMDFVGRQNVIDLNVGVSGAPWDRLTVAATGHFFWRAETTDALYNAGGGVVRAGNLGASREVGQEIDVTFKYGFSRHLAGEIGYGHFFAGDFIDESGANSDMDFLYVQMQFTF